MSRVVPIQIDEAREKICDLAEELVAPGAYCGMPTSADFREIPLRLDGVDLRLRTRFVASVVIAEEPGGAPKARLAAIAHAAIPGTEVELRVDEQGWSAIGGPEARDAAGGLFDLSLARVLEVIRLTPEHRARALAASELRELARAAPEGEIQAESAPRPRL